MRYWLSAALLANIALFLTEFHFGAFKSVLPEKEATNLQGEREIDSNKNKDAPDRIGTAPSPLPLAKNADKDSDSLNAAWPKIESSPSQDNISLLDSQELPTSLMKAPIQSGAGTPPLPNGNADSTVEKTAHSVQLSSPTEPPSTQTLSSTIELAKDPVDGHSAGGETGAPPTPAPVPASPAAEKNVLPVETFPTSVAAMPENPQKDEKENTIQPVSAIEKPAKVKISPARSSGVEAQSPKNKNVGNESPAKEMRPASKTQHTSEKVLTACYIASPVDRIEALNALLSQFRPQLTELAMSSQVGKARKNNRFIVIYPALPSLQESFQMATSLKDNYGIRDLQVIRDGEMKGAISLGVFSSQRNAELAQSKFEQKGLQVQIKPPSPAESTYKVRMRWTAQQEPVAEQLVDALSQSYPDTQRITNCQ